MVQLYTRFHMHLYLWQLFCSFLDRTDTVTVSLKHTKQSYVHESSHCKSLNVCGIQKDKLIFAGIGSETK